ncbi:MAG: hypothetical protein ACJAUC_002093, partial [Planctomycetota bacterium]
EEVRGLSPILEPDVAHWPSLRRLASYARDSSTCAASVAAASLDAEDAGLGVFYNAGYAGMADLAFR